MNDTKLTIAAEMLKAKEQAKQQITSLLWSDAAPARIVESAIKGNLSTEDVEAVEKAVQIAKDELTAMAKFNVPELLKNAKGTKLEYIAAEITHKKAEELLDLAYEDHTIAGNLLKQAQTAFQEAARKVIIGEVPAERMPPAVLAIVNLRKAEHELMEINSDDAGKKELLRGQNDLLSQKMQSVKKCPDSGISNQILTVQGIIKELVSDMAGNEKRRVQLGKEQKKLKALTIYAL